MPVFVMVIGIIAASHALAGRQDQARRAMHQLRQLDPALSCCSIDRRISPCSRMVCEKQACRNDGRMSANGPSQH
jgi:hypothetical protein